MNADNATVELLKVLVLQNNTMIHMMLASMPFRHKMYESIIETIGLADQVVANVSEQQSRVNA